MRARVLATVSCVLALFAVAAFTSAARSQSTPPAATTPTATIPAATTVPAETTTTPAATSSAAAPAPQAAAAQDDDPLADAGTDVPELVVDYPETEETEGDSRDDGELELVEPKSDPKPAATPTAAPVAASPVVTQSPATAQPEAPAANGDSSKKDDQAASPKDDPKQDPSDSPLPEVAPAPPITTPGAATPGSDAAAGAPSSGGDDASSNRDVPAALKKLKPYKPAAHAEEVMAMTAGGAAALGAIAAGLGAAAAGAAGAAAGAAGGSGGGSRGGASGGGASGGGDGGGDGGWLEDVELERDAAVLPGLGWGDRSRTWGWRMTPRVDNFSKSWPDRLAQVSPVLSRVSLDGDYLRAILGGLYLALFPVTIALGIVAAHSTGGAALPPTFGLFLAILLFSIFDSMLGYSAGLAFAATLLINGEITDGNSIRLVAGLILIWFALPLAASAVRPLRREITLTATGLWDHATDLVLAGLFAGWIAANQISALGPLRGYELPIADERWTVTIIVFAAVGLRILIETAATHLYPERLDAVQVEGECEPPRLQEAISTGVQMAVLAWISSSFMGWKWALWIGTIVFFIPLIPWLFIEKMPYSRFIAKWQPIGLAKWAFVIVGGVLLGKVLDAVVTDPTDSINWGFIVLPLPVLLCWGLELFAENEDEDEDDEESEDGDTEDEDEARFPMTWPLRLLGVPVLALCVYLVYFVIG